MKTMPYIASVALVSASLAACDSQAPVEPAAANRAPASPSTPVAQGAPVAQGTQAAPNAASSADAELSDKVKCTLTSASGMEIQGVEVQASNGVVTLYGMVEASSAKDRAAILALGIDGVRSVVNNLVVIRGS
ncbi:MAG TPA: BON domain-containing protein [Burkholderiales bacterium]|nr:BON domain-containing protein [Burkholderiales bacterium]